MVHFTDVNEQKAADEEVSAIVNCIIDQSGFQLSLHVEISSFQIRLHERHNKPRKELGGPVDNSPEIGKYVGGNQSPRLLTYVSCVAFCDVVF